MTIAVITGTRPEIIKMYPLIKIFDSRSIDYKYIHTGQHYDYNLFLKFIEEFEIRKPDFYISADVSNPVNQVSSIMGKLGSVMNELRPSLVLVEGDTNSVLAGALAALKSNVPIGHVESGLRSNGWKMVEEHNRKIVDHVSDILFSPTEVSTKNLKNEHVQGDIHTVGNTVIDAVNLCLAREGTDNHGNTPAKGMVESLGINEQEDGFVLVTLHRSENVDEIGVIRQILMALSDSNLKYIFPMHPRTLKRIQQYGLRKYLGRGIKIISPLGYFDFLRLLRKCKFVVTDSGGVQEEITSPRINKRALVLREWNERPESVLSGHSVLSKIEYKAILEHIKIFETDCSKNITTIKSPYGSGDAANKIAGIIKRKFS
jgi:UDP-N-acetylglucosamine 2-epimerase (non-hydrolysing)